jgi:transcriptional regulator with XRE-family HTH domain
MRRPVPDTSRGVPLTAASSTQARHDMSTWKPAYPGEMSEPRRATLGEFIRAQRELSEVSMRHFAEMVGISNPYLSQIERGLRAPSEAVLQSIADVLQVSAETLFDQAGVPREEAGPSKVVAAIREDPRLTGRQRQAMIETYEAFVGVGARPRRS